MLLSFKELGMIYSMKALLISRYLEKSVLYAQTCILCLE